MSDHHQDQLTRRLFLMERALLHVTTIALAAFEAADVESTPETRESVRSLSGIVRELGFMRDGGDWRDYRPEEPATPEDGPQ